MRTSVHIVKHLLFGTVIVLLGAVSACALAMAAVQIVDDAPEIPRSWYLATAVAMGAVALAVSIRARAARELQRQVDRMQWTHSERTLIGVAETNRRHADRLHAETMARLYELGLTFSAVERGRLAEAVEQLHAARSILTTWAEYETPDKLPASTDMREPVALLELAMDTLADVALNPLPPSPVPCTCVPDRGD